MRKRLRDWPVTQYKFFAVPIGDLPQSLWSTAKEMQRVWNEGALLHEAARIRVKEAYEKLEKAEATEAQQAIWAEFRLAFDEVIKQSQLNWECQQAINDRFVTACSRAKQTRARLGKGGVKLDPNAGWPRVRHGLRKIAIPHRWSGGGKPVGDLIKSSPSTQTHRFWMRPVATDAYTENSRERRRARLSRGFFGIQEEQINFSVFVHRPIPDDAIVKTVAWLGRFTRAFQWKWALAITVETPHRASANGLAADKGRTAGLDLGWRKFDEYLRVGMLVDGSGNTVELRVPFNLASQHVRRYNKHRAAIGRPASDFLCESFLDLEGVRSEQDQALEECKAKLLPLLREISESEGTPSKEGTSSEDGLSAKISGMLSGWRLVRNGGLYRLHHTFSGAPVVSSQTSEALKILEAWIVENRKWTRRYQASIDRLTNRRNWLYRNLAAWIANRYDTVVWEGDLAIKEMAEEDEKGPILDRADRYRQIAAIGVLRQMIADAMGKAKKQLVDHEAAYTTATCSICGGTVQTGPKVRLICENGHGMDQDENSARNLLFSQMTEDSQAEFNLRTNGAHLEQQPLGIPDPLRSVAVIVQLT